MRLLTMRASEATVIARRVVDILILLDLPAPLPALSVA
jgi:hypothetical protein